MAKEAFDFIRGVAVADTPEERVRQALLRRMVEQLEYPKSLLAVEKSLHQLPHLQSDAAALPQRRADLLCFAKGIDPRHELFPLLVIECKAVAITSVVLRQVEGYNHYIEAPFIGVANQTEIRVGWKRTDGKGGYQFIDRLPTYPDLLAALRR